MQTTPFPPGKIEIDSMHYTISTFRPDSRLNPSRAGHNFLNNKSVNSDCLCVLYNVIILDFSPPMRKIISLSLTIILLACILTMSGHLFHAKMVPLTNLNHLAASHSLTYDLPSLDEFSQSIFTGDGNSVTGIYVPGKFAFPVIQQPEHDPGYVSNAPNLVTEFRLANQYNTLGLLAHSHLAGSFFFELAGNQPIIIIYGNGRQVYYIISQRLSFRALSPNNTLSSFENLQSPEGFLSAAELFDQTYGRPGKKLILQTCIPQEGSSSWGRLFIIATPQLTR